MCIIVVKPKHKELQNKNILERCFTTNKDGAGYMFVDKANDVVEIKKGFMNFNDFYKSLIEDYKKYKLKDQTLVMHFRIGTSGKSATGCTHPFPVTTAVSSNGIALIVTLFVYISTVNSTKSSEGSISL